MVNTCVTILTNGQREYVLRPPCVHVKYPTSEKRDYNVS